MVMIQKKKISMRSESYESQSFARLYEKTNEWLLLLSQPDKARIAYKDKGTYKDVFIQTILQFIDKAYTLSTIENGMSKC